MVELDKTQKTCWKGTGALTFRIFIGEVYLYVIRKLRVLLNLFSPLDPLIFTGTVANPNTPYSIYLKAESRFFFYTDKSLRNVRKYFKSNGKGYGEDALFGMWSALLEAKKPSKILEIGVYRGQTPAFWTKWAELKSHKLTIVGLSPYENVGDEVSLYPELDYEKDIETSFEHLRLPMFHKVKSLSTAVGVAKSIKEQFGLFDVVYVDGGHDLDVVLNDVQISSEVLVPGGLMVLDDAAGCIPGKLPAGAFHGHPGPSEVAVKLMASEIWQFLFHVGHNVIFQKVR